MAVEVIKFRVRAGKDVHYPGAVLSDLDEQDEEDLISNGICRRVLVAEAKPVTKPDKTKEDKDAKENEIVPLQNTEEQTPLTDDGPATGMPAVSSTPSEPKGKHGK